MRLRLVHQLLVRGDVVRLVVQADAALRVQRHAVLGRRQVLRHHQPVHAARHPRVVGAERNARDDGVADDLGHHAVRAALRLDVAQREARVRAAEVEVVDGDGLLEHRVVAAERMEPLHHRREVRHVAPADEPGRIGEALGLRVGGRAQQQRRRVRGAARHDEPAARRRATTSPSRSTSTAASCRPVPSVIRRRAQRAGPQRDVGMLQRRPDAADLGVALRVQLARERVAGVAQHAAAVLAGPEQAERQRRRDAAPAGAARRRSPACRRRAAPRDAETDRAAVRSDRCRLRRARRRAARRDRSTAPACRSRSARPARRRRCARSAPKSSRRSR